MKGMLWLYSMMLCFGTTYVCGDRGSVSVMVEWIAPKVCGLPNLQLSIENRSEKAVVIPIYDGYPLILLDYWNDYEGLVLIELSQYRLMLGGFVVLDEMVLQSGETASFILELESFVAQGGQTEGTSVWQDDFENAQCVRVIARVDINGEVQCSKYAHLER